MYPIAFLIMMTIAVFPLVAILAVRAGRAGFGLLRPTPGLIAAVLAPIGMLFLMLDGPGDGLFVVGLIVATILFAWAWVVEFVTLMGLGDEAFPGRFDKLIWVALMVCLPPVGLISFRVFRRAYWPAEKPAVDTVARELA